jgi:hypothetical protein
VKKEIMEIQKLNWAGVKLISNNKTILIDAVEDYSYYKPVLGDAVEKSYRIFRSCTSRLHSVYAYASRSF